MEPADESAQGLGKSGISNFENVVRGMILGHESEQESASERSKLQPFQQTQPVTHVPSPNIQPAHTADQQQFQAMQSRGPAKNTKNPRSGPGSTKNKSRPVATEDAAALLGTPTDAPLPFSVKPAKHPRRHKFTAADTSQSRRSLPGQVPTPAEPSSAKTTHETLSSQQQQSSSGLKSTPPANVHPQPRPPNQQPVPQAVPGRHSQQSWRRGPQQATQHQEPQQSPYNRPPPQHQRLFDPHATSHQSYFRSGARGPISSSRFGSTQSHHAAMQAQVNYLESIVQVQVAKAAISSEEEQEKESMRRTLENVCRKAVTEYELVNEPLFDESTVSLKCFGSLSTGFATRSSDMDLALGSPMSKPDTASPESNIPRVLEKALLDLGYGARLLTRTRVPIIRFCEKPTPELAARLLGERLKWEKERDAAPKIKKSKETKDRAKPESDSKQEKVVEKPKGAKAKEGKGEDGDSENKAQHRKTVTDGHTIQANYVPGDYLNTESVLGEHIAEGSMPIEGIPVEGRNSPLEGEDILIENTTAPVDSASACSTHGSTSVSNVLHNTKYPVAESDHRSPDPKASHKGALDIQRLSLSEGHVSSDLVSETTRSDVQPQGSASDPKSSPVVEEKMKEPVPPKVRLEETLPNEELVRLYRLAMNEGWFEPQERGVILTFIKAFEGGTGQGQVEECRSQLLSLPDVLNRYRPPPEHHLDFPKDGVGVQCDINFSNRLALHNSHMLRCYGLSDPRVRPMVLFVKAWAKCRSINSAYHGTLSSYGYVLMVLHYLVNVAKPPICLNLQTVEMAQRDISAENTQMIDGYSVRFWRNEQQIQQWARNSRITPDHHSSVGSLLRGFFRYFAVVARGFSWGTDVLSLRTAGGIVSKKQKEWVAATTVVLEPVIEGQKGQEIRQRYLLAIEDPFEINHNVGRTVVHNGIVAIRDEFRRAH
ncbi:MAG: hypothetical protein L6R40_008034, partial [Gallowayella cf. fulva]